jgi:PEP-CTERM motif-containing protein
MIRKLSLCAVLAAGLSQSAQADVLVNADFTLLRPDTVAMTGAAAIGAVGDTWNSIDLATGDLVAASFATTTTGPLVDASGAATALTLTIGGTDVRYWGSVTREPLSLMQDQLAPAWPGGSVTINNVTDGTDYDLYLYGASLNGLGGRFTVDGVAKVTSGATQAGGVLVEGQDYVVYNVTAAGTEIVINYGFEDWQSDGPAFNGLQISEVIPEPATLALLGLGGLAALSRRR